MRIHIAADRALRGGVRVELTPLDGAGTASRYVITQPDLRVLVTHGRWRVEASLDGHTTAREEIRVSETGGDVRLELRPDRDPRTRLAVGVSLGAAALGLGIGGAAMVGRARSERAIVEDDPAEFAAVLDANARQGYGGALLGASLGAATVALTAGLAPRRRALIVETALGGALLVAGAAWYATALAAYEGDSLTNASQGIPWSPDREFMREHARRELAGALVLGAGAAMVISGGVSLAVRRTPPLRRGARLAPWGAGRATWGVTVQGTF